nr:H-NS histone family protein [Ralstonia solanacearum]
MTDKSAFPKELLAQKAKLDEQLETARQKELAEVTERVRQVVLEYGLTAEDIGLAPKRGKRGPKSAVAPKYRDPKTGATWSGRGRAPAWIGKNRDRFLIA